ncbi:hypothetical protein ANCDUO_19532, partial [Ancylostoma duodenale]
MDNEAIDVDHWWYGPSLFVRHSRVVFQAQLAHFFVDSVGRGVVVTVKTREAARAWRVLLACIIDELRGGFDGEARYY